MTSLLSKRAACLLSRVGLAYGFGEVLLRRVELNTPVHSLISIKEALFWKQVGRSPYTASTFRGPPLLLQLFQSTASHLVWQATLLSVVDLITSLVLSRIAVLTVAANADGRSDNAGMQAALTSFNAHRELTRPVLHAAAFAYIRDSASFLCLVNPFLVLSTAAGSAANLANLAVITALYGGLSGNAALAGLGLAAGTYLSAHPVLLLVCMYRATLLKNVQYKQLHKEIHYSCLLSQVPTALLLIEHDSCGKQNHQLCCSPATNTLHQDNAKPASNQNKAHIVLQLLCYFSLFIAGLILLSDMQLRHYSEHFITSLFAVPVQKAVPLPLGTNAPMHWTWHVYSYMLTVSSSTVVLLVSAQHNCFTLHLSTEQQAICI
ncbi:hypothetical protein MMC14_010804 [Varicellaria rhodocarpa]|nr:hypothetical protein [Varicellaria rhodocarpa]